MKRTNHLQLKLFYAIFIFAIAVLSLPERSACSEIYLEEHCNNLIYWTNKSSGSAFVKIEPSGFFHLFDNDTGAWKQADILYDNGIIKNYYRVNCLMKFNKLCTSTQIDTMDGSPIDGTGTWDTKTIVPKVGAEYAFSTTSQRLVILFLKDEIWLVRTGFVFVRVWSGNLDTSSFHDWEFIFTKTLTSSKIKIKLDGVEIISDQIIGYPETRKAGWVEVIAKGDAEEPVDWHLDYIKLEHSDSPITQVSIEPQKEIKTFFPQQNYPNPFGETAYSGNPVTNIKFQIPKSSYVSLRVFDILGREVAVLVDGEKSPAEYEVQLTINDPSTDGRLPSGIYFYQLVVREANPLRAVNFIETKKMIYMK